MPKEPLFTTLQAVFQLVSVCTVQRSALCVLSVWRGQGIVDVAIVAGVGRMHRIFVFREPNG